MKYELPSPITDESFHLVWDYANNKLIELKKKKLIRKIIVLVANTVFFISATAILLNILANLSSITITAFLDTLGPLKTLLDITAPIISHPSLHIIVQTIIYLAFLFVPAILASGIVMLIIWFAYPVAPPNTRTEDNAADAKTLMDALFEIQVRGKKVEGISSIVFIGLFVIELMALSLSLFIFAFNATELLMNDSIFTAILQLIATMPTLINATPAIFIILYGIYAGLNELLSSLLKPFYKTELAPTIQQDAKKYYYECNPSIKNEYEEEERILQRAIEIKAKRRQEEAELLEKINYQNPIYKYIKMGILTVVIIISLVIAGNKLKSLDIEKFLNELGIESLEGNTESTESETQTEVNNE